MADITHTFARKLEVTRWGRAVEAAFVAGAVFLIMQMLLLALFDGRNPMEPARWTAAIVMGQEVLWQTGFDIWVLVGALLVNFGLAVLFAWILTPIIAEMRLPQALATGAVFGLALFIVNFYLLSGLFAWFRVARGWITLFNHLLFGVTLAWSYLRLRDRN